MSARYASRAPVPGTVSLREAVSDLFESLRASVTTRLQLAAIEGRRAGSALAGIAALGVLAAVLAFTAWLVAVWGITWGLMELGLAPWLALVLVVATNLVGAWICFVSLKRLAQRLTFPATLRHLHVARPESETIVSGHAHEEK